jgi:thioredoxin 1
MSNSDEADELERIREQKRERLKAKKSDGSSEASGTNDVPETPIEIESQSHFEEVTASYETVLVDCYADWCGPCQMMESTIEALAAESDAAVAKVDVDRHQHLDQQLGTQGVPTLVVFSEGKPVKRVVGAQDRTALEQLIEQAS